MKKKINIVFNESKIICPVFKCVYKNGFNWFLHDMCSNS